MLFLPPSSVFPAPLTMVSASVVFFIYLYSFLSECWHIIRNYWDILQDSDKKMWVLLVSLSISSSFIFILFFVSRLGWFFFSLHLSCHRWRELPCLRRNASVSGKVSLWGRNNMNETRPPNDIDSHLLLIMSGASLSLSLSYSVPIFLSQFISLCVSCHGTLVDRGGET